MKTQTPARQLRSAMSPFAMAVVFVAVLAMPELALAGGDFQDQTCGFLESITGLLQIASVAVVTIAVIFAGYQIAFAHKRISDVAPILIGGVLIGAAGQLAAWIMPERATGECGDIAGGGMAVVQYAMSYLA